MMHNVRILAAMNGLYALCLSFKEFNLNKLCAHRVNTQHLEAESIKMHLVPRTKYCVPHNFVQVQNLQFITCKYKAGSFVLKS